jgi:cytochrome c551/c552
MALPRRLLNICLGITLTVVVTEAQGATAPASGAEALHKKECGACHTPYQAYFLPAASWEKIMAGLNKHFGENAELSAEDQTAISQYLAANAADRSKDKRGARVMSSLAGKDAPLRLTETSYIIKMHHEVPKKVFVNNPKLKNLSNCGACHPGAATGNYDEHQVKIPGVKNWEKD